MSSESSSSCAGGPTNSTSNRRLPSEGHEEIGTAAMSPELGFVLFVALLWGPTALWLFFRTIRGLRASLDEPFAGLSDPTRNPKFAVAEPGAPDGLDGSWFCGSCSSLNRREADRCYRCRARKSVPDGPAPGDLPVGPGIPVMAAGVARSSGDLPVGPGIPVMAAGVARSSGDLPVGPGIPVMAAGVARSSGEVLETAVVPATPGGAPLASETPDPTTESVVSAASPSALAGAAICPFLGFRDDSSTRFDFPDTRNLCHATAGRGTSSVSSRRPSVIGLPGTRKPQPIGVEHQESHCLTAEHEQCARYPAREAVTAN